MNHQVKIELAEPEDIPVLQEIERKAAILFRTHPQTAALDPEMTPRSWFVSAQRCNMLWVARSGQKPVGFALVEDFGTSLHLEELDVLPEHGRQGIGRSLVQAVCVYATSQGRPVTLCTFSEVPWNAPFYERLGFVRLSPAELSPALRRRIEDEDGRGLPSERRVAMRLDTTLQR
jgi:ribosomal protein S18 acetylase RimI-like enzyme